MKRVVCSVLLACIVLMGLGAQERSGSGTERDLMGDNYSVWSQWTHAQRSHYVWGLMTGSQVMAAKLTQESGHKDLLVLVYESLPKYAVRDYVVSVNYIYEVRAFRDKPFWALIFNVDHWIRERREYE